MICFKEIKYLQILFQLVSNLLLKQYGQIKPFFCSYTEYMENPACGHLFCVAVILYEVLNKRCSNWLWGECFLTAPTLNTLVMGTF